MQMNHSLKKSHEITALFIIGMISCGIALSVVLGVQFWSDPSRYHCSEGNYRIFRVLTTAPEIYPYDTISVKITAVNQTGVFGDLTKTFVNNSETTQHDVELSINLDFSPFSSIHVINSIYQLHQDDLCSFKTLFYKPDWQQVQRFLNPVSCPKNVIVDTLVLTSFGFQYLKSFFIEVQKNDVPNDIVNIIRITFYYDFDGRLIRFENSSRAYNATDFWLMRLTEPLEETRVQYDLIESDIPLRPVLPIYPVFLYIWTISCSPILIIVVLMRKKKGRITNHE